MAFEAVLPATIQRPTFTRTHNSGVRLKDIFQLLLLLASIFQTNGSQTQSRCSCEPERCQSVQCAPSAAAIDACTCCQVCLKGEGGRCGGLFNSAGMCQPGFRCAARLGSIFGTSLSRIGVCEASLCLIFRQCPFRQRCMLNRTSMFPQFSCVHFKCAGKFNPVCGHNNREYLSVCHLQEHECQSGAFIGIKTMGPCQTQEMVDNVLPSNTFASLVPETGLCEYENNYYAVGDQIQSSTSPCVAMYCIAPNTIRKVLIPGCGDNKPEPDFGVDKSAVHGGWSEWTQWTNCTGSCGSGAQSRNRTCTNPAPKYEGRVCEGVDYEERECLPAKCQVKALCSKHTVAWSYWSPCSATCGSGKRHRKREYLSSIYKANLTAIYQECPRSQFENCSVAPCVEGSCKGVNTYDYLWSLHPDPVSIVGVLNKHCRSIQRHHFMLCSGKCSSGNSTSVSQCCRPSATRSEYIVFQCNPNIRRQRLISINFPISCQCQPC